jgi:hypothetical protein
LFGGDVDTIGVALDRLEKPAAGSLSCRMVLAETAPRRAQDLLQRLGRGGR